MKPLDGISVVNCRPSHQASELNEALAEAGATPVNMPLLEVAEPRDGGAALLDAIAELDNFDWILITSTNGVVAVANALGDRWPDSLKVGSVGSATTRALERRQVTVHYTSELSTAEDLGKTVPLKSGDRVLAPLGDRASTALTDALSARGFEATRIEAYRTLWTEPSVQMRALAKEADYVFLTSPAIAKRFSEVVNPGPPAVCIGPTTATAAAELGLKVCAVATKRGPDGLISALVNTIR